MPQQEYIEELNELLKQYFAALVHYQYEVNSGGDPTAEGEMAKQVGYQNAKVWSWIENLLAKRDSELKDNWHKSYPNHWWTIIPGLGFEEKGIHCCLKCGVIERGDKKEGKCRGWVKVGLRL